MKNPSFESYSFATGMLASLIDNPFPTRLHAWQDGAEYSAYSIGDKDSTFYGFVLEGTSILEHESNGNEGYTLKEGMWFCAPRDFKISGGAGFIVERVGFLGVFQIGGPIEEVGRLRYIDGCSDSLLIPPVKKGDPCLNHLHFPENISQTAHTHPSMRIGVVAEGRGICKTPWGDIDLVPGMIFIIKENSDPSLTPVEAAGDDGVLVTAVPGTHSFFTYDECMEVIAWHPDTNFGPTDEDHPMILRTYVNGVPASELPDIQTK